MLSNGSGRITNPAHVCVSRARRAFTLLELLVVVAIIGLLMGIILAGVGAVKEGARRARAKLEAQSVIEAIQQYRTEFGHWPGQDENNLGADAVYATEAELKPVYLALTNNARDRAYIEIPKGSSSRCGCVFLDPWLRPYAVIMDYTGNGELEQVSLTLDSPAGCMGPTNVEEEVAVFSWGNKPGRSTRWVYTWPKPDEQ